MSDTTHSTPPEQPSDRLVFREDLVTALGVGKEALRRWIKAGKLPKPDVAITRRTMAWKLSTLQAAGIGLV